MLVLNVNVRVVVLVEMDVEAILTELRLLVS